MYKATYYYNGVLSSVENTIKFVWNKLKTLLLFALQEKKVSLWAASICSEKEEDEDW